MMLAEITHRIGEIAVRILHPLQAEARGKIRHVGKPLQPRALRACGNSSEADQRDSNTARRQSRDQLSRVGPHAAHRIRCDQNVHSAPMNKPPPERQFFAARGGLSNLARAMGLVQPCALRLRLPSAGTPTEERQPRCSGRQAKGSQAARCLLHPIHRTLRAQPLHQLSHRTLQLMARAVAQQPLAPARCPQSNAGYLRRDTCR